MQLPREVELLLGAQSLGDVNAAIAEASRCLGFRCGSGFSAVRTRGDQWVFSPHIGEVPAEFGDTYEDPKAGRRDSVLQYVKRSAFPLVWNRQTYEAAGEAPMYELQSAHGLDGGICGAIHLPGERHFALGLNGLVASDAIDKSPSHRMMLMGRFQMLLASVQVAYERLAGWPEPSDTAPADARPLTQRELECLRWSAEGKTAWEIGMLLSLSERTVKKHLETAMFALDCSGKTHAVAKAIRLQLI